MIPRNGEKLKSFWEPSGQILVDVDWNDPYLDCSIPVDDNNLEISGYNLIHSDHPSNSKHGGVSIYYIQKIFSLFCCFALCRYPSQTQDDFLSFSQNFELNFAMLSENNPYLLVGIGDFNAKLRHWYSQDTNTFEGSSVENVASQFGLHQIIKEPMYILENSSSCQGHIQAQFYTSWSLWAPKKKNAQKCFL